MSAFAVHKKCFVSFMFSNFVFSLNYKKETKVISESEFVNFDELTSVDLSFFVLALENNLISTFYEAKDFYPEQPQKTLVRSNGHRPVNTTLSYSFGKNNVKI